MKLNLLALLAAATLLAAGTTLAQNSPGAAPRGRGNGYGKPAQSAEERTARQAACQEKNGGVCPQGGVCAPGKGQGQGKGNGQRHGLRDGTGPRHANGAGAQGSAAPQPGRQP